MVTFIEKAQIEEVVGTKIKNLGLYQKAFTHKSALKEYENLTESFETLEFIGDSVLGFVITKFLFDRYESRQEGFLTKARTKLVRGETLAHIANHLGLQNLIIMDEKGMRNGWNNNPKILEDAFEALIGAIYMDLGLLHAKEFVLRIYTDPTKVDMNSIMVDDNFKDHLMRYCQVNNLTLPEYRVAGHHENMFYIDVYINGTFVSRGVAKSKNKPNRSQLNIFSTGWNKLKEWGYVNEI